MSGAAYRRGNAVISRQTCGDIGCPGCVWCRKCVPTPRPADWGEKAVARALDVARRIVRGARKHGLGDPPVAVLAEAVRERARRESHGDGRCRNGAQRGLNRVFRLMFFFHLRGAGSFVSYLRDRTNH